MERYVFLVKNLRGVLAVLPSDDLNHYIEWLSRRFKYRDLGIPPCLYEKAGEFFRDKLNGDPFHILAYPTKLVEEAAKELASKLSARGLPGCISEALLLASAYAAPVHTTTTVIELLEKQGLVAHVIRSNGLDDKLAKLHLRIIDYTVLDSYVKTIEMATSCIKKGCRSEEYRERIRELAASDSKRYWRLNGREHKTIAYIDYVSVLLGERELLARIAESEARILLALIAAFNLDSIVSKRG